ncbi:MAG: hypothetical protein QM765_30075 [Myxococcales bacterium]
MPTTFLAATLPAGSLGTSRRRSATSAAESTRGVCSDIPSAPFFARRPAPDSKASFSSTAVASVSGTWFGAETQSLPWREGASRMPTSQRHSSGGRTVTRKIASPLPSPSNALCDDV